LLQRIALFDHGGHGIRVSDKPTEVSRFSLYGEGNGAIAPEFLHIEPISDRSSRYEWTISPHSHPGIFQLLLLQSGSGVLASEGAEAALRPVTLVALPSGCVHAFRFGAGTEGWVLSIAADLLGDPRIAALFDAGDFAGGRPRWVELPKGGRDAARAGWLLSDLALALAGDRSGPLPNPLAAQLALVLAVAGALLAEGEQDAQAPAHRADLVRRFRQLAEQHFREGWSVARYADALGTTVPTLTRHCRALAQKAPGELLLDRLLLEAMRALTYTRAGVGQIADDLGFADPAYFARFFKGRTGMTASAFRRQRAWLSPTAPATRGRSGGGGAPGSSPAGPARTAR
jgi:AraC family transcriptional activator of pobA